MFGQAKRQAKKEQGVPGMFHRCAAAWPTPKKIKGVAKSVKKSVKKSVAKSTRT
jgi:hypothetical protein